MNNTSLAEPALTRTAWTRLLSYGLYHARGGEMILMLEAGLIG